MARVNLIQDRQGLSPEQQETFDWVVESRGAMIRPYEVLLHAPGIARPAAELGAQIRYQSSLTDHDRELVIITAAVLHGCGFEWDSHLPLALAAGVREEVVSHLRDAAEVALTEVEELIIGFVRELCAESTVSEERFARALDHFGERATVELCATVGYYTFLAFVMGACGAC